MGPDQCSPTIHTLRSDPFRSSAGSLHPEPRPQRCPGNSPPHRRLPCAVPAGSWTTCSREQRRNQPGRRAICISATNPLFRWSDIPVTWPAARPGCQRLRRRRTRRAFRQTWPGICPVREAPYCCRLQSRLNILHFGLGEKSIGNT